LGLFFEFLLSMESMEPGQLSITLYSVCKIQNLNTESPLWMFDFFSTTYSVLSVRILSVSIFFLNCHSGFRGLRYRRLVLTTDTNTTPDQDIYKINVR